MGRIFLPTVLIALLSLISYTEAGCGCCGCCCPCPCCCTKPIVIKLPPPPTKIVPCCGCCCCKPCCCSPCCCCPCCGGRKKRNAIAAGSKKFKNLLMPQGNCGCNDRKCRSIKCNAQNCSECQTKCTSMPKGVVGRHRRSLFEDIVHPHQKELIVKTKTVVKEFFEV
ncbi:unnamed protein product [Bursaphelenchus xylophilus]|uniref:(pine wood nematode) hypothetical protein n=1 Tax=Bursaphelenchus xylophilus TaxID=6326 RepID=A0A1I7S276_BURXY|nr:unnamed protein product [Bursaphelenchus xylophilus]CAG9114835.1 unnamed protein product [Bursaphelenchus xylophilus]